MPLRGCGGGFGKCSVPQCILCILFQGCQGGLCAQKGGGWTLPPFPLPHLKTNLETRLGLYWEVNFLYGSSIQLEQEGKSLTQSVCVVVGG